jgi:argininosuccinate synthase
VYVEDLRSEFVTGYVWPAIKANAMYEGRYMLGTSIARPCIAKRQVEIAQAEGAAYVAHGATGKGNDQVRFELSAQALDARIKTIAPWRDPEFIERFKGRSDLIAYAEQHGIPVGATKSAPYSVDDNLYHTSYESGMLEDPMVAPLTSMFRMTKDPREAPNTPANLRIEFEQGVPVQVINLDDNTTVSDPLEMMIYMNRVAGDHGVDRIDIVENRFVGIKSRGVYETPAGTVFRAAHMDLELLCLDREVLRIKQTMELEFSRLCYYGFWFAPEMEFVRNSIDFSQREVTGAVNLSLYKGNVTITGRESPKALYIADLASMEMEGGGAVFDYNPTDAQGFIRVNAVRLRAYSALRGPPSFST